jgi:hypothetical protein
LDRCADSKTGALRADSDRRADAPRPPTTEPARAAPVAVTAKAQTAPTNSTGDDARATGADDLLAKLAKWKMPHSQARVLLDRHGPQKLADAMQCAEHNGKPIANLFKYLDNSANCEHKPSVPLIIQPPPPNFGPNKSQQEENAKVRAECAARERQLQMARERLISLSAEEKEDLLRRAAQRDAEMHVPVYMSSKASLQHDIQTARDAGKDPFSNKRILVAVAELLFAEESVTDKK